MTQAKIELKLGTLQFTGEADADWLEKQLDKVLAHVRTVDVDKEPANPATGAGKSTKNGGMQATTTTIAAKLSCKVGAGRDVITAAAAKLTLVDGKESFTRTDLAKEAKTATSYYKATILNNMTGTLIALVKSGEFTEISQGVYSLSATAREKLEKRLAP